MSFRVEQVKVYRGPNHMLPTKAICFRLEVGESSHDPKELYVALQRHLPQLDVVGSDVGGLFARTLLLVQQLDMELAITQSAVEPLSGTGFDIAVQTIDEHTAEDALDVTVDMFNAAAEGSDYPFEREFKRLQHGFDRSLFGGPTIYSIVEAGLCNGIPMAYLPHENVFQWGYGRRQVRGRSTTMSLDGIKDTEFTCFKDMVKHFLADMGLPTPRGSVCHEVAQALRVADDIGYPLVIKPVAGHKGQGVTTNIQSGRELERAFAGLLAAGIRDGIIVESHVTGFDHRLLTVGGTFVAALKREPAFVFGDGERTIGELIDRENETFARRDNARSALTKIRIDDDLADFLRLQDLRLSTVIAKGRKVFLRRVANISAGGVSINVTDEIHPDNKKLAEDVAAFLRVHCLGVDVLADDITRSWRESPLSIIEINAGPGVFMHLVPAHGGSIDVPGAIIRSLFPTRRDSRVPILVFDRLSADMRRVITPLVQPRPDTVVGSASAEGVFISNRFLSKMESQWLQVGTLLRHQSVDVALIEYREKDIMEDGLRYTSADVA
ncbi:MAG: cyanophycin synthetase, partial [Candidatus Eisenbacteria bacterium]|nr:cyanophycin synthetase [Candidatus Eisenbacteria bacterium]